MQVEDVNGVPTHVFTLNSSTRNRTLLLVIPGSPGMGHFYIPFATRLFQRGGGAYDVAVVSHAGHSPGVAKPRGSGDAVERDWYSLEDQIDHKMAYIEQQAVDKDSLFLVGHSIGCYMILKMLQLLAPERVKKAIFLFPTIEKMALTPNGQFMSPLFTTFRYPFIGIVWLLSNIPEVIQRFVLKWYFYTTPSKHLESITLGTMNIDSRSIYNILCMANQEMTEVMDLPEDIISESIDKLVFYYGVGDKWNMESCYTDMARRFPGKDINLCQSGYPHAFVETSSDEVAEFVYSKLPQ